MSGDQGCLNCTHASDEGLGICDHYGVADADMEEAGFYRDPGATNESVALGLRIRAWLNAQAHCDTPGCPGWEPEL